MRIGELAAATDTSADTLRFYEREGLLPAPTRSSANYRVYDEMHSARVAFIRRCRTLDMNLEEIRALPPTGGRGQVGGLSPVTVKKSLEKVSPLSHTRIDFAKKTAMVTWMAKRPAPRHWSRPRPMPVIRRRLASDHHSSS